MQEETSFQVSPFLSISQCSKTFESSWEFGLRIPTRDALANWGKSGHLGYFWPPFTLGPKNGHGQAFPQAFALEMRRAVMTTKYIMNMFFISKQKFKIDK